MLDTIRGVSLVFTLTVAIGLATWGLTDSKRVGGTAAFLSPFPLVVAVYRVTHRHENWRGGTKLDL